MKRTHGLREKKGECKKLWKELWKFLRKCSSDSEQLPRCCSPRLCDSGNVASLKNRKFALQVIFTKCECVCNLFRSFTIAKCRWNGSCWWANRLYSTRKSKNSIFVLEFQTICHFFSWLLDNIYRWTIQLLLILTILCATYFRQIDVVNLMFLAMLFRYTQVNSCWKSVTPWFLYKPYACV